MIDHKTYKRIRTSWRITKLLLGGGSVVAMGIATYLLIGASHPRRVAGTQAVDPAAFIEKKDSGSPSVPSGPSAFTTPPAAGSEPPATPTGVKQVDKPRSQAAAAVLAQMSEGPNRLSTSPPSTETSTVKPAPTKPDVSAASMIPAAPKPAAAPPVKKTAGAPEPVRSRPVDMPVSLQPMEMDAPEVIKAKAAFEAYRSTQGWWQKMRLVRDPGRVAQLAHHHYDELKLTDPPMQKLVGATRFDIGDESYVQLAYISSERWSNTVRVNCQLLPGGEPLLDWESLVAYSDSVWEDFVKNRVATPQIMRVYVAADDYFNYEFADREKFISFQIKSPDGKRQLNGYCERESETGHMMLNLTSHLASSLLDGPLPITGFGPTIPATIKISFPEKAQSDRCVRIHSVQADRWVLTASEQSGAQ